jgi:putative membrane protein
MRSGFRFFSSLVIVLALGGAVAGCGDDDDSNSNAETGDASINEGGSGGQTSTAGRGSTAGSRATAGRSGGASGSTAGNNANAGSGGVPAMTGNGGRGATGGRGGVTPIAGTGSDAGVQLSDAQIAAVTAAANRGEIQLGTIALSRARLPEVRAFAQEMITMHGAAQDRATALLQSLNITPVDNNLSTQLEQDAQRAGVMLQNAAASDVDLSYVQSQVDIHTRVLAIFDEVLLPSVTELALRTDLTLVRADVQRHLTEAQALLLIVQTAPPDLDAGTDDAGL